MADSDLNQTLRALQKLSAQSKRATVLDIHSEARKITQAADMATRQKLEALLVKVGRLMARQKFKLDIPRSHLSPADWGSDGAGIDGRLYITDEADVYRSEDKVREIFDAMLGVWPMRGSEWNEWRVDFGK